MPSRRFPLVVALALAISGVASTALAIDLDRKPAKSPALCAPGDPNREPGIQGQVPRGRRPAWDCGVRPIGFLAGANGALAVAGHCAYTGGGLDGGNGGVRVIDVRDPTQPRLVRVLDTGSRELLGAQLTATRGLLATRHRAAARDGQVLGRDMLVDVWDVFADCTNPRLLRTVRLSTGSDLTGDPPMEIGGPAHNLKFNPAATKLYGSLPPQEIDVTDLAHPEKWTVRRLNCVISSQSTPYYRAVPGLCEVAGKYDTPVGGGRAYPQLDHEPSFNADGSRLYLGGQLPDPYANRMLVIDMTKPTPVVLGVEEQAPGHSIDFMTIKGRKYLLHSNEISATGCALPDKLRPTFLGFADRAYVLDVTNERDPKKLSEIRLAASKTSECSGAGLGGPSTAYHDVDNRTNTTYAVIGFTSAGHRIFDMRNPRRPVEVAYFNHGASEHTKSYVNATTGHIWASNARGFWVLQLEDQVRAYLGLR